MSDNKCIKNNNIHIPEHMVKIKSIIVEPQPSHQKTEWMIMDDLKQKTNYSRDWLEKYVLNEPYFKKILDVNNGGFVHYPKTKGDQWKFEKNKMINFLDEYFSEIFVRYKSRNDIR